MKKIVKIREIYKTYKRVKALKGVTLDVFEGSIHAILGENGAGKSTLLKLLTGFCFPDSGEIYIGGKWGFLPEDKALYVNKTVREMLMLSKRLSPLWNKEEEERLCEIFPQDLNKKIGQLSFGKRTQLYFVILFSQDLPIYILDEPTMGLDPLISEKFLLLIKEKAVEGKTIIYSTHNLYHVEEVADTVTLLKRGEVLYSGELDDLREERKKGLKEIFLEFMGGYEG